MDALLSERTYAFDRSALPPAWAGAAVPLAPDEQTRAWVSDASTRRHGLLRTLAQRLAVQLFDDFAVNGVLGTYDMFLSSAAQWRRLLGGAPGGRLLDVGAGDGAVTARLAELFDDTVAPETARSLARRLEAKGFRAHRGELSTLPLGQPFDAVALLNVLDRVHAPLRLLDEALRRLRPAGRLLVATPLPFESFVLEGPTPVRPRAPLVLDGRSWEAALADLVRRAFEPRRLRVETFARAPYLSRGDARHALHARDDAVLVLRR